MHPMHACARLQKMASQTHIDFQNIQLCSISDAVFNFCISKLVWIPQQISVRKIWIPPQDILEIYVGLRCHFLQSSTCMHWTLSVMVFPLKNFALHKSLLLGSSPKNYPDFYVCLRSIVFYMGFALGSLQIMVMCAWDPLPEDFESLCGSQMQFLANHKGVQKMHIHHAN
jgi:hypothetical protein